MAMRSIPLTPVPTTPRLLRSLEKRGLIRTLTPTAKVLRPKKKSGAVDRFYASSSAWGGHTLLCIGKKSTEIKMTYHPDNEELILINGTGRRFKPLYLIVGLHKQNILEKKAARGALTARDFLAIELSFNDPRTSFFVMLKDTPHCEVTLPGRGMHPIFFVTEPAKMKCSRVSIPGYKLAIRK
jgi:hypothetical protein